MTTFGLGHGPSDAETIRGCLMRAVALVVLAIVMVVVGMPSAHAADKNAINDAIKKGGEFLRQKYTNGVQQISGGPAEYGVGAVALSGIAMLEAGVKPDDPAVKNVAQAVRNNCLGQNGTYHIALCILFLDRLGDRGDVAIIQMLGVRLYAGMGGSGGWTYNCWEDTKGADTLLKSLQNNELTTKPTNPKSGKDDGFMKPEVGLKTGILHPEVAKVLASVHQSIKSTGRPGYGGAGDNSNTQFGIVGLWVASRHGVPAKDAFALIESRFVQTQMRDGGWAYASTASMSSTVAMTCAGLLGLAVGRASRDTVEKKEPKKGLPEDDPFFNPKKGNGEKADKMEQPTRVDDGPRDRAAEAGLKVLAAFLSTQPVNGSLQDYVGAGNSLYTLWSLERVGVAYGLEKLGGVDWYDWGATRILAMQLSDGSFSDNAYQPDVNTSFALLFLAKSNFTKELGHKKTQDPGKGELRGGGGAAPLHAPPPKDPKKQGVQPQGADPDLTPGGFSLPKVAEPTEAGEAEKVSKALLAAGDAEWPTKLAEARDTKGAKWTRGLVLAISKLDGDKRHQAREALADRLVRMTPRSLKEMMKDPEIELRRAACLACGMRDERAFAPALIERLTDPSDYVVRAARASLRGLTNNTNDFGPVNASDEDAKIKAANQWSAYFDQQGGKK